MFFGIRKRSICGSIGTLRGWLSAHIYLGTTLILLVLLHAGFQWMGHPHVDFVLMLIVSFRASSASSPTCDPSLMTRNRESATRDAMLDEVSEIDQNALALADGIDPKIHAVCSPIENTESAAASGRSCARTTDQTSRSIP